MKLDKSKLSTFGRHFNHIESNHGSFHTSLFETFLKGSSDNRTIITKAFPDYFNEYDITLNYPYIVMEKYYYVFGSEAAILYEDGFEALLQAAKDDTIFLELFVYAKDMHPNVLLNMFKGNEYYVELSEDEYDQLKST